MTGTDAFGGYFGWEPSDGLRYPPLERGMAVQSGRAALLALLLAGRPSALWLPSFVCADIKQVVDQAGVRRRHYRIGSDLLPVEPPPMEQAEWWLGVNYFGLRTQGLLEWAARIGSDRSIIDNAQALFADRGVAMAAIYSARKFVGVPDGGWLCTQVPVPALVEQDTMSLHRCRHLGLRQALGPEAGLDAFRAAERSFAGEPPRRMSALTEEKLAGIDMRAIRERRSRNFHVLHHHLQGVNAMPGEVFEDVQGPLCYPLLLRTDTHAAMRIRRDLVQRRIFLPTYWTGVADTPVCGDIEREWPARLLPIPCDQRLDEAQLLRLADAVIDVLNTYPGTAS